MKAVQKTLVSFFLLLSVLVSPALAFTFAGNGVQGSFTGSFLYTVINTTNALIHIALNNTSPVIQGGYLTAFAFNNPGNRISGVTLTSSNPNFQVIGGGTSPKFRNGINAQPYGFFDMGASISTSWQGSGNPNTGIPAGGSATFDFALKGEGLGQIDEWSFANELSRIPWEDHNSQPPPGEFFVARFRGFHPEGGDKVPATVTPEPISSALFLMGGAAFVGRSLRRRR